MWNLERRRKICSNDLEEIVYICMEMDVVENPEDGKFVGWFLPKDLSTGSTMTY